MSLIFNKVDKGTFSKDFAKAGRLIFSTDENCNFEGVQIQVQGIT